GRSDMVAAFDCRLSQPDNHLRFFSNVFNGFDSRAGSTLTVSVPVCSLPQSVTANGFGGLWAMFIIRLSLSLLHSPPLRFENFLPLGNGALHQLIKIGLVRRLQL